MTSPRIPASVELSVPPLKKATQWTTQLSSRLSSTPVDNQEDLVKLLDSLSGELRSAGIPLRSEMVWTAGALEDRVVAELKRITDTGLELDQLAGPVKLPEPSVLRAFGERVLEEYTTIGTALHAASEILEGRVSEEESDTGGETMARRQLERARVLASIKREELEALLATVRDLVEAAEQQQQATEKLLEARNQAEAGEEINTPEVVEAFEQVAQTLSEIGESVSELTDQTEVANQPLPKPHKLRRSSHLHWNLQQKGWSPVKVWSRAKAWNRVKAWSRERKD